MYPACFPVWGVRSVASHFVEEHRLPHTAETDEHETPGRPAQPVPLDCNISRGEDVVAPGEFRWRGACARRIGVREWIHEKL